MLLMLLPIVTGIAGYVIARNFVRNRLGFVDAIHSPWLPISAGILGFLFAWPHARSAVMGPQQLAGVMSIVSRQAAQAKGVDFDEEADASMRAMIEYQIEQQSTALAMSGRLYDDGVIDPRDTRTILAICLSVIENRPYAGTDRFGVFRP